MREYELTYLLLPNFSQEEAEDCHKKIKKKIAKKSNLSEKENLPERRVLAYEINKNKEGYIASLFFNAEEKNIAEVKKIIEKEKDVMRHIIVKKETRSIKLERKRPEKEPKKEKTKLTQIDEKIEEIT